MGLRKSKINYVGADGVKPFGWNPGGAACSNKCDGCWSLAKVGPRMKCKKCRDNIVHLHEERLGDPYKRKKPSTMLVNFTCDTWDQERLFTDILAMMIAAAMADWHTYLFLTKNPIKMRDYLASNHGEPDDNYYWGLSICNQADADAKLPTFLGIPGKKWISYEPAWGPVNWGLGRDPSLVCVRKCGHKQTCPNLCPCREYNNANSEQVTAGERIEGMIIGHDNRKGAPGTDTLLHIRSTVRQCKAAGIPVYVKQIWRSYCDCGDVYDGVRAYGACGDKLKARLRTDPKDFPEDLRIRDLPWGEKEQGK